MSIPYVKRDEKGIPTLYVHDKPFFMRGGEIHNSSASDSAFLDEKLWPALRGLNLNSVIVPLYWELIEPAEGKYDFSLLDEMVASARWEGLKLCFLWFGLWKNAESFYVPAWMKKDTETYFRAEKVNGEKMKTISPLCTAAVEKDRRAFTAVMRHIKEIDEYENTIVVMQVENEIGLLGTDRDYSPAANAAFNRPIPEKLGDELGGLRGTWKELSATTRASFSWHGTLQALSRPLPPPARRNTICPATPTPGCARAPGSPALIPPAALSPGCRPSGARRPRASSPSARISMCPTART